MKKVLFSLLFLFVFHVSFAQCIFGFEHISTQLGDSAVVIKKYGFPNFTEFRLIQTQNSNGTGILVDTTINSQVNDTLLFNSQAELNGWLDLSAVTPAGDTLGFFKSMVAAGFPLNIGLTSYTAPTSISSSDGVLEFYDLVSSTGGFVEGSGGTFDYVLDSLSAGINSGVYQGDMFTTWDFQFIMGDPEDWVNIGVGGITCPIGVHLATNQSTCDGEAYIGQVQNGVAPYTYEWNGSGNFGIDTTINGLCVGNHYVTIQDQNGDTRTCAFAMGSLDNGYFPPNQSSDTTIHTFTEYCMDSLVDSVSVIGSQIIDSVSFSVVWSFYDGTTLLDQLLDTFQITVPNGTYNNIALQLHLVCNGDTLKSSSSVYSAAGYISIPFSETGFLGIAVENTDSKVLVYPNPANSNVNIELDNSAIKKVAILNDLGQEIGVDFNRINKDHIVVDLGNISRGSYTVQIFTEDGVMHIKKVVKN